ncbi:hypothetical protein FEDK69T_06190 [Flavobacterium enshiense DK69]|uniref:Polysaccharide biosynthesis protein n=1 Tax=Flavobacterium enshiense DK69 TaxID=1107311 RepID=V6SD73_9FLAO|nr:hypothetical protein [Flavobacterium enshiense]ESU24182.1 hypothetical protein FEDK69T_06190 [Flavobacterium enshiense DK69]KGO95441.1 hypothetical protein Q767_11605 [Flavobacterium enshiense DK69]
MSAFYKGISGLSLFVSIPLLIHYLGTVNYGVWVLIFTLFQLVLLMDFGLASVLKTKIPELKHSGTFEKANAYIKSTYKVSGYIALAVFLLSIVFFALVDVKSLLNIPFTTNFVMRIFLLNIFFFCINFIMNTHKALFVSVHKGKYAEQSIAVNQISFLLSLSLPLLFLTDLESETKLYLISLLNGLVCFIVNLLYTLYFFKTEEYTLFTSETIDRSYLNDIFRLGIKYMGIQVGTLFLFSSDNYILAYFFGPEDIVPYEIVTKYFQFPLMILIAGMAPLWSIFTKNYLEKDQTALKHIFKKFNYFFILILIGMIVCMLLAPYIFKIWISKDFVVPQFLLIMVTIMTALRIFSSFYSYFFNGIGNLKSYLLLLSASVLLKVPLSYFLITEGFGISSVVMSSGIFLLFWSILQPIEAYNIVSDLKIKE